MKDISLYGHLTIDNLIDGETEKKTLGSIANVWKALIELDSSLNIGLSPIDIGEALIYIDKKSATRVSKASLNLKKFSPKVFESKIHHLTYLNEMSERSFIASLDGIITADICPGRPVMKEVLSQIDYLFISDEDCDDFTGLVEATKGWVILHSATGSICSNGEDEFFWKLHEDDILKNVNVLGAGDIFASCCLYKLLEKDNDIHNWIEFAHRKTTEILRYYST
tara:strand:- start:17557 stop:18228 length:672 start_codon:yes stop_codon:yes gene_type:complete